MATELWAKVSAALTREFAHMGRVFDEGQAEALADAVLVAIGLNGQNVIVPKEPTEAQWGGLARDIMMWLGFDGQPTPRRLFDHLGRLGRDIPQWLRDEPEMQSLDRVPSKGTRCMIIYRAMLESRP